MKIVLLWEAALLGIATTLFPSMRLCTTASANIILIQVKFLIQITNLLLELDTVLIVALLRARGRLLTALRLTGSLFISHP